MESVGFKEWQVVCDALASGRQTVILRKGGIHEGRAGFSFAHESFYLFPTRFHAQGEHVREGTIRQLPEIRERVHTDVIAAYNGDPAAKSFGEIIFCYPMQTLYKIFTHLINKVNFITR